MPKSKGADAFADKSRRAATKGRNTAVKPKPESPSKFIDEKIRQLPDWQGKMFSRVRRLIKQAVPEVIEEVKWRGVPVWSREGIICTGETYKKAVKLTFAKGAFLENPGGLFNSSLEGSTRRAIDLHEGDKINEKAFKSLVRAAAALNGSSKSVSGKSKSEGKAGKGKQTGMSKGKSSSNAAESRLLSGGNPQIAKAEGDSPVQAYIAAMPGWKREVGRRLDAIITRTVPNVRKAVKWNSPFYGIDGRGWFLNFHCFKKYVKVAFFRGKSLRPVPPGESKTEDARYLDIYEDDKFDEKQLASWIKQASKLPGWVTSDIGGK